MTNIIEELKARGLVAQETHDGKLGEILAREKMAFFAGFDPSADSLHIGSLALIVTMTRLAGAGHKPIFLMGGATGLIGDPSGKIETRKMLGEADVERNLQSIKKQIGKILGDQELLFVNNFDWLKKFNYLEFLRNYGPLFKVNEMVKSETYRERLEKEYGLTFLEFNYLILQAVDYLHLFDTEGCRLQIGGSDQWGNILAGVELVRRERQTEAYAFTIPLIERSDGKKMGKSEAGAVWLDAKKTSPFDFYQYWVNVDDKDVGRFLKIFTFLSLEEIAELDKLSGSEITEAKDILAYEVTKFVHGEEEAEEAKRLSYELFSLRGAGINYLPPIKVSLPLGGLNIVDFLVSTGISDLNSKRKVRELISSGGIYLDLEPVKDLNLVVKKSDWTVLLRVGKKKYYRIEAN